MNIHSCKQVLIFGAIYEQILLVFKSRGAVIPVEIYTRVDMYFFMCRHPCPGTVIAPGPVFIPSQVPNSSRNGIYPWPDPQPE
jgi:hypothetical protein